MPCDTVKKDGAAFFLYKIIVAVPIKLPIFNRGALQLMTNLLGVSNFCQRANERPLLFLTVLNTAFKNSPLKVICNTLLHYWRNAFCCFPNASDISDEKCLQYKFKVSNTLKKIQRQTWKPNIRELFPASSSFPFTH